MGRKLEQLNALALNEVGLMRAFLAGHPNAREALDVMHQFEITRGARQEDRDKAHLELFRYMFDNKIITRSQAQGMYASGVLSPGGAGTPAIGGGAGGRPMVPLPPLTALPASPTAVSAPPPPPQPQAAAPSHPPTAPSPPPTRGTVPLGPVAASAPAPAVAQPAPGAPAQRGAVALGRVGPAPAPSTSLRLPTTGGWAGPGNPAPTAVTPGPTQTLVQPIYLAVDGSHNAAALVPAVTTALQEMLTALQAVPDVATHLRISIMQFTDAPRMPLALSVPDAQAPAPLVAEGQAVLGPLLDELLLIIPENVKQLKDSGFGVMRPLLIIVALTTPDSIGPTSRSRLIDRTSHPTAPEIAAFGLAGVDPGMVGGLATQPGYAFVATGAASPDDTVGTLFGALVDSLVMTGRSIVSGAGTVQVKAPDGFQAVASGIV
jgi:uncharacterized protein YegL